MYAVPLVSARLQTTMFATPTPLRKLDALLVREFRRYEPRLAWVQDKSLIPGPTAMFESKVWRDGALHIVVAVKWPAFRERWAVPEGWLAGRIAHVLAIRRERRRSDVQVIACPHRPTQHEAVWPGEPLRLDMRADFDRLVAIIDETTAQLAMLAAIEGARR